MIDYLKYVGLPLVIIIGCLVIIMLSADAKDQACLNAGGHWQAVSRSTNECVLPK